MRTNTLSTSSVERLELNTQELKYIQQMLQNWSHSDMALLLACSESHLRQINRQLKAKLGKEEMTNAQMMQALYRLGILNDVQKRSPIALYA